MNIITPWRARPSIVWLVYLREMRDQLRDRRTIFTILILPLVLYPILGSLLLQVAQFSQGHRSSVGIIGSENLPASPSLLNDQGQFQTELIDPNSPMHVVLHPTMPTSDMEKASAEASRWVQEGMFDCVLIVPKDFVAETPDSLKLLYNFASDPSRAANDRTIQVLVRWRDSWVQKNLAIAGVDQQILKPFQVASIDIAPTGNRDNAFWSKMLPFVMLVWAMTGAFYPAIDLVAGEKERGTLETLLCSPALRTEIVMGKLAAVTTFSMVTAILNVVSMLFTGMFVAKQVFPGGLTAGAMGTPPLTPMLWLLVALFPLSMLFSSLALAVAALARSSKEGQYYLMPLMMMALPLVMLPMLPGIGLNAGTSMIPVTGMFLMARALMDGQYAFALAHLPIVASVTMICLWLATRWAGRQFEDESVLFRSGEQWSVSAWMKHLWRDRQGDATVGTAFGCAAAILIALFFAKLAVTSVPSDFPGIAKLILIPQIGIVLAPTLLMACILTRSLSQSLQVRRPPLLSIPVAILLGISLHPAYMALGQLIQYVYPLSDQAVAALSPFEATINNAPIWHVILVLALVPAICEELAFRGFIFAGLLHNNGRLRAVVVTAVLFGLSHGILQQSLAAMVMGLLLGWVTLRTGSIFPSLIIHFLNNSLGVSLSRIAQYDGEWVQYVIDTSDGSPQYRVAWILMAACVSVTCLIYFSVVKPQALSHLNASRREMTKNAAPLSMSTHS
jgi:sodium transport system permease protein